MNKPREVSPQEAQRYLALLAQEPVSWADNLAHTVTTEPDRIRAAAEQAWDAACDYLASRNWENMTRKAYTDALMKAWNANPHRDACVLKNEADR